MKKHFELKACLVMMLMMTVTMFLSGCGKSLLGGGSWNKALSSIEVTPSTASIAKGTTIQFRATGIYSDSSRQDLTSSVTWSSSDNVAVAVTNQVGNNGSALGLTVGGPITITASDPTSGRSGSALLTVTAATLSSVEVTQIAARIAVGTKAWYLATGIYSDATKQDLTSSVTWSSSNPAVATISNQQGSSGVATSLTVGGPVTMTATDPATGILGTGTLTVTGATLSSLRVTPVAPRIALGTTVPYHATGTFSDQTTQDLTSSVVWSSSNPAVATISNQQGESGTATSTAVGGPITITATDPISGRTGGATLTVTGATLTSIGVSPAAVTIPLGTREQFVATGIYSDLTTQDLTSVVTWSSSNANVATIGNAAGSNGWVTPLAAGGAIAITATDPVTHIAGSSTLTVTAATLSSIVVTPVPQSVPLGLAVPFIATGTYSDLSTRDLTFEVTWSCSNLSVAAISNAAGFNGVAVSLASGGPVTVTAMEPVSRTVGSTQLTVTAATLSSIAVSPLNSSIALGTNELLIATGTYSDLSTQDISSSVTWNCSNALVAVLSNATGSRGEAFSQTTGTITVTVTDPQTGKTGSAALTVTPATLVSIAVAPTSASLGVGATELFTATGTYSDSSTQNLTSSVTWSISPTVAAIDNAFGFKGLVTALSAGGPATVTASEPGTGKVGTAQVTVTAAP